MNKQRIIDFFSASYAQARRKFLEAAQLRGLALQSFLLPMAGAEGETLAMDVARDGPPRATRLLVVISGVHGLEGFCGSAIQTGLLSAGEQGLRPQRGDTAVLYVHAVNPYGFSHLRRATQENVDLNRNFVDFAQPLPQNAGYAEIHDALLPPVWPPRAEDEAVLAAYREPVWAPSAMASASSRASIPIPPCWNARHAGGATSHRSRPAPRRASRSPGRSRPPCTRSARVRATAAFAWSTAPIRWTGSPPRCAPSIGCIARASRGPRPMPSGAR